MVPTRPDTIADMVIGLVRAKQVAECLVPFLILFDAHILSFYEWKIVQQLLGDNFDVTCVSWQINMQHLREKIQFLCF